MTQLLEQALTEVRKLPEVEQEAIASLILDELASTIHERKRGS